MTYDYPHIRYPHNSAVKGKFVWAPWYLEYPVYTRPRRLDLMLSRGAYGFLMTAEPLAAIDCH
jgi:hypothetical protein